jgi:hypothetical protein
MSEAAEAPWLSPQLLGLTALLLESHQRLFQRPLVRSHGIRLAAQELFVLDEVVLCHDGSEDPRFLYANRAALQLFSRNWEQMVGMPSRLSTSANQRLSRREQLELAKRQDKLENYSGVRVNSQGRRFQIRGARIWSLIDQERHYSGQAACFSQWWWEP